MKSALNRASTIGHPCIRWHMCEGVIPSNLDHLQGIFARGKAYESWLASEGFKRAGYEVLSSQRDLVDRELDLSGHPDFVIRKVGSSEELLVDSKSLTGGRSIRSWDRVPELLRTKYRAQLECYMRLDQRDKAGLYIGDALDWYAGCIIECQPEDELWETIRIRCLAVQAWTERLRGLPLETLLAGRLQEVPGLPAGSPECRRCQHRGVVGCAWSTEGLASLDDPELLADLEIRAANEDAHKEFVAADQRCKERAKAALANGGEAIAGDYAIKVSRIEKRIWSAPKQFQGQHPEFAKTQIQLRCTIGGDDGE